MKNNNNMICDLETGVCGVAGEKKWRLLILINQKNRLIFIM